eukprot:4604272-Pyramimonas_sp.AAC.1
MGHPNLLPMLRQLHPTYLLNRSPKSRARWRRRSQRALQGRPRLPRRSQQLSRSSLLRDPLRPRHRPPRRQSVAEATTWATFPHAPARA